MKRNRVGRQKVVALILSGIFPGLGQLYNRELLKGVLFLAAGAGLAWPAARALALIEEGVSPAELLAILTLLAVWIWSVIDAWRGGGRRSR